MINKLRNRYPQASLKSELVTIHHGKYIIRALVEVDGVVMATGLAAADTVETAEDRARNRAIEIMDLESVASRPAKVPEPVLEEKRTPQIPTISIAPTNNNLSPREEKQEQENLELPQAHNNRQLVSSSESATTEINGSSAQLENEEVGGWSEFSRTKIATIPEPDLAPITYSTPDYHSEELDDSAALELVTSVDSNEDDTTVDFSEIIAKTDWEMKRLGWNTEQGKNYLLETYGKRSRHYLSDEELREFLEYLENQP